jgi:hypothetical protein
MKKYYKLQKKGQVIYLFIYPANIQKGKGKKVSEKKQLQILLPYDILAVVSDHENKKTTCRRIGLQRYGDRGLLLCR